MDNILMFLGGYVFGAASALVYGYMRRNVVAESIAKAEKIKKVLKGKK